MLFNRLPCQTATRNRRAVRWPIFAAVLTALLLTSVVARAQDYQQYRNYDRYRFLPRLPQGLENPPPFPSEEREVTGSPTVLVKELKGLVILDDPAKVVVDASGVKGVEIRVESGMSLMQTPEFRQLAESYIGGPISIRRLNELVRDIIRFYRNNDQPVVDVGIPAEQDITDGVVQVVVTESRIGTIRIEGTRYFNPYVLLDELWIAPGDPIYESQLQQEVRWLIRNPFRRANLEISPGKSRGLTDVTFKITDKRPFRIYAGYEDTGTQPTGLERTFYGFNWDNAFWKDDQLGYQYTASSDFHKFDAHSFAYSKAFYNRDIFSVYGTYADFNAPIPGFDSPFPGFFSANQGDIWQVLPRYTRELRSFGGYSHSITAGFDFKRINSQLVFGGVTVLASEADVVQMTGGYTGRMDDRFGTTNIGLDSYFSPGNLSGHNNNAAFQTVRAGATANYYYSRAFFQRITPLTSRFNLVARLTGQLSEGNLLPTEQLGFGGYNSIRGYNMYSVVADSGYFANLELHTQPIYVGLGDYLGVRDVFGVSRDQLKFLGFYDFGDAYNHTLLPGEDPSIDMQGVGVGMRYALERRLSLRADYAWQLPRLASIPTPRQRWHIGAVFSY